MIQGHCEEVHALLSPVRENPANEPPTDTEAAIGRFTVPAEREDVLAVLRTGILLARNFRTTLHIVLPKSDGFRIHFGSSACRALLAGFLDSAKRRLDEVASVSGGVFLVEIGILPAEGFISIHVRSTDSVPRAEDL